jgi:hypothetical protein
MTNQAVLETYMDKIKFNLDWKPLRMQPLFAQAPEPAIVRSMGIAGLASAIFNFIASFAIELFVDRTGGFYK